MKRRSRKCHAQLTVQGPRVQNMAWVGDGPNVVAYSGSHFHPLFATLSSTMVRMIVRGRGSSVRRSAAVTLADPTDYFGRVHNICAFYRVTLGLDPLSQKLRFISERFIASNASKMKRVPRFVFRRTDTWTT